MNRPDRPEKDVASKSDEDLLRSASEEDLEELYRRNQGRLKTLARRAVFRCSDEDAHDIAAQAWTQIVARVRKDSLDLLSFKAWAVRVVRNAANNFLEARRLRESREVLREVTDADIAAGDTDGETEGETPSKEPSPFEQAVLNERHGRMKKILRGVEAKLSPQEKLLFRLMLENKKITVKEIALILRKKQGAVHTAQSRLRDRIGEILAEAGIRSIEDIEEGRGFGASEEESDGS